MAAENILLSTKLQAPNISDQAPSTIAPHPRPELPPHASLSFPTLQQARLSEKIVRSNALPVTVRMQSQAPSVAQEKTKCVRCTLEERRTVLRQRGGERAACECRKFFGSTREDKVCRRRGATEAEFATERVPAPEAAEAADTACNAIARSDAHVYRGCPHPLHRPAAALHPGVSPQQRDGRCAGSGPRARPLPVLLCSAAHENTDQDEADTTCKGSRCITCPQFFEKMHVGARASSHFSPLADALPPRIRARARV